MIRDLTRTIWLNYSPNQCSGKRDPPDKVTRWYGDQQLLIDVAQQVRA